MVQREERTNCRQQCPRQLEWSVGIRVCSRNSPSSQHSRAASRSRLSTLGKYAHKAWLVRDREEIVAVSGGVHDGDEVIRKHFDTNHQGDAEYERALASLTDKTLRKALAVCDLLAYAHADHTARGFCTTEKGYNVHTLRNFGSASSFGFGKGITGAVNQPSAADYSKTG